MNKRNQLLQMIDELSEEEICRVLDFAVEINETNAKDLEEHAPAAFWDNDDKIWNEMSR